MSLMLGYFGFLCTVIGQVFLMKKKAVTFLIWNISSGIQLVLAIQRSDTPLILTYFFYVVINFITYFAWRKQNVVKE